MRNAGWIGIKISVARVVSINKSITSILVEIAQEQGELNIEDKISHYLDRGWSKSSPENESKIAIRHLLTLIS